MATRVLLVVALVILSSPGLAGPCTTATWDVYQGLADCTIGNSKLSNFDYVDDPLRAYDPKMITAKPDPNLVGLDFTLTNFSLAEALKTRTIEIKFKITESPGSAYSNELIDMSDFDPKTGDLLDVVTTPGGVATIKDDPLKITKSSDATTTKLSDSRFFFLAVNSIDVDDSLKLEIGMMGSAQIISYKILVTPAPEPSALLLLATALAALGALTIIPAHRRNAFSWPLRPARGKLRCRFAGISPHLPLSLGGRVDDLRSPHLYAPPRNRGRI